MACSHGVAVDLLSWEIIVHKIELQSRYYVHFLTDTDRKGMNPLILPDLS